MKKLILSLSILLLYTFQVNAQQPPISPEEARKKLEERGISEDEVLQKIEKKGIDVDNINPNNVDEVERALEEAVEEIENENESEVDKAIKEVEEAAQNAIEEAGDEAAEEAIKDEAKLSADEIKKEVEKGKSLEEAISEELVENQEDLPPSKIWGQHIFRDQNLKQYNQSNDIRPPKSYILGVGDEVVISIWGPSDFTQKFVIDDSGYIKPTRMQRIYLKGISLGKAEELLRSRFSNFYSFDRGEFEVTLNFARTISINFIGEVNNMGTITIPATNTAFNALVAAGGPSNIGSVRNISLYRDGESPQNIDIYEYLNNPSIGESYFLQNGDNIHIPISERLVSINGAVKKPFTYELKRGEELKKLVEWAGGFKDEAYQSKIQIKRYLNDKEIIEDVNYRDLVKSGKDFQLLSGDVVSVLNIPKEYRNFVKIDGAVDLGGTYELSPNMKLTDLVQQGILSEDARTDVAYIFRERSDKKLKPIRVNIDQALANPSSSSNITLQARDRLKVFSKTYFINNNEKVQISGSVRNPGAFNYEDSYRVSDVINLSGGLKDNATKFAYILRKDPSGVRKKEYIKLDLPQIIRQQYSNADLVLRPNDEIVVFNNEFYLEEGTVSIAGAVRKPITLEYDSTLTIQDILKFAGGLKDNAKYAYIKRKDPTKIRQTEYIDLNITRISDTAYRDEGLLRPNDQIVVLKNEDYIDKATIEIEGEVRSPTVLEYDRSLSLQDALIFAGGLKIQADNSKIEVYRVLVEDTKETRVVVATLEVDETLNIINSDEDFVLAPFDQIIVRPVRGYELQRNITLRGEVERPGRYPILNNNETISSIIERAGGLTEEAFAEGANYFRKKDGVGYIVFDLKDAVNNKESVYDFIVREGDVIEIPKLKNFVTIQGAVNVDETYTKTIADQKGLNVPYHEGKNAKWYVDEYAAGVDKEVGGKDRLITVEHPSGKIEKSTRVLFYTNYPEVTKGSIIKVGQKTKKDKDKEKNNNEEVNWGEVFATTLSQVTAIVTLIVLIQRID